MNYFRHFLWAGLIGLGGCALQVENIKPAAPYDFTALQRMAKYAQAAYLDDAAVRTLCRPAFGDVYIQTIPATNNKYYLATSTVTQTQLIAIAGTANIDNVLLDADLTQEFIPELRISLHRGFAKAARLIYLDVKPRLVKGYRLQITGHSLGGAEAVIMAMLLKAQGLPAESIITFGQPRVSNQVGVDAFFDLPLTRVVNGDDIIPELPPIPFSHIAPELILYPDNTYSVVKDRPMDLAEIAAAWQALRNHQAPAELPQHYIANYLIDLDSKTSQNKLVPYHD